MFDELVSIKCVCRGGVSFMKMSQVVTLMREPVDGNRVTNVDLAHEGIGSI